MALACPSSLRWCLGTHQSPRIVPCRPSGWGHLLGMQEWGGKSWIMWMWVMITLLCVWVILFFGHSQRDQGIINGHPSWGTELLFLKKLLPEKSPLVRLCKGKAPGCGQGLSLAMAELGMAVSWAAIQLDSAQTHSLQKAEKETGKNDRRFPWLLDCLLSSDCYHKFCHPNKQQMSEITFRFGESSFQIHHGERYWPGAQGSGTSSSVGKT